ncbi:hypothetical protein IF2G_04848 [Cordyceps javanica]|nr:hypothetical protein IF2G_04848 [Cordyceps javanica]
MEEVSKMTPRPSHNGARVGVWIHSRYNGERRVPDFQGRGIDPFRSLADPLILKFDLMGNATDEDGVT